MQQRLRELEQVTADPDFWNDEKRRMGILKEQAYLDRRCKSFLALEETIEEADVLYELGTEEKDTESLESQALFLSVQKDIRTMEIEELMPEEADSTLLFWTSIPRWWNWRFGLGGYAQKNVPQLVWTKRIQDQTLEEHVHEEAGIKSCSIEVQVCMLMGI